jgi:hypothetical protein
MLRYGVLLLTPVVFGVLLAVAIILIHGLLQGRRLRRERARAAAEASPVADATSQRARRAS